MKITRDRVAPRRRRLAQPSTSSRSRTDEGLVGWSEYNESFGGVGVSAVIERLAPAAHRQGPAPVEAHVALMCARAPAGQRAASIQQAIGAIENALLDIKAKALGIPVYELFGGPVRDRIRLYWSHCGTYRRQPRQGAWASRRCARWTTSCSWAGRSWPRATPRSRPTCCSCDGNPRGHVPGFARGEGFPELNADRHVLDAMRDRARRLPRGRRARHGHPRGPQLQLQDRGLPEDGARHGAVRPLLGGDGHAGPEGAALHPRAAPASRSPRASACSGGATTGRSSSTGAVDVAIIDMPWNGVGESLKIAAMADAYEINVAPHNFYGHLATMMSAHFVRGRPQPAHHGDRSRHGALAGRSRDRDARRSRTATCSCPPGPAGAPRSNEEAVRAHPPRSSG